MKETDSLENQLRSWQPRRPSAGLERKLFAAPMQLAPKLAWAFGSLAPVAACVLLTLSNFNSGSVIPVNSAGRETLAALISSNQSCAANLPGGFRGQENKVSAVIFDWTNHGNFTSSMSPFFSGRMN
jgi:hypothetical protein